MPNDIEIEDRRKFLISCGRFAAVTPPAMALLLSTSLTSTAIARSGLSGHDNGPGRSFFDNDPDRKESRPPTIGARERTRQQWRRQSGLSLAVPEVVAAADESARRRALVAGRSGGSGGSGGGTGSAAGYGGGEDDKWRKGSRL